MHDPLPFTFISEDPSICENTLFIDVDYAKLMKQKCDIIRSTSEIRDLLGPEKFGDDYDYMPLRTKNYVAVACDLSDMNSLKKMTLDLQLDDCFVLFVAEVSITYMDVKSADSVIKMASSLPHSRFCLLEQWLPDGPDHPFASTMLHHFNKLYSPVKSPLVYQNEHTQKERFRRNGWPTVDIQNLWSLWSDNNFISPSERQELDLNEPFDEWEEFALFGCHYFLLIADSNTRSCDDTSDKIRDIDRTKRITTLFSPYRYTHELHRHSAVFRQSREILSHGGHGVRGRLSSGLAYSIENESELNDRESNMVLAISLPKLEVVCHTICKVGNTGFLLAGGRKSPERASKLCLWSDGSTCSRAPDLPDGIFRHCAIGVTLPNSLPGVLIFGGKTGSGEILKTWHYWFPGSSEWQTLALEGDEPPARFGASMSVNSNKGQRGHLTGGLDAKGQVLSDLWEWELLLSEQSIIVKCTDRTAAIRVQGVIARHFGRFGASLVEQTSCLYLIGGVGVSELVPQAADILQIDKDLQLSPLSLDTPGPNPLLVGHSALLIGDERVTSNIAIVGGGATCFSFGSFWNKGAYTILASEQSSKVQPWTTISTCGDDGSNHNSSSGSRRVESQDAGNGQTCNMHTKRKTIPGIPQLERPEEGARISIERVEIKGKKTSFDEVVAAGRPVILESLDLGRCTESWDLNYLNSKIGGSREIVVHFSHIANMDFLKKNFQYKPMDFNEFANAVESGERVYLRSLSLDKPAGKPANLAEDFPTICDDFVLPPELALVAANQHSSPLRISGPVNIWLHYDVLCNVYCQIRGRKRLALFPPWKVDKLQFPHGASSSSINIFDAEGNVLSEMLALEPYVCDLAAGEVLVIPALWPHAAFPLERVSIAVNVFFRNLERGYAAGKDVYGNRDIQAYENGRKDVLKIEKAFQGLPADFGRFYLRRLAAELNEAAMALGAGEG